MALEPTDAISVAQARDWANALSSHEAESVVEQIIRSAFSRTEAALNRAILTGRRAGLLQASRPTCSTSNRSRLLRSRA